jgi:hypothetical protein
MTKDTKLKNEVVKKDLTNQLQIGDIIFDPAVGAREVTQADIDRISEREREAEEKRRQEETTRKEMAEIRGEIYRKKHQEPIPFKPSRLVDVDTDLMIMNMNEDLQAVKETVNQIETMLWEIEEDLCKDDKQRENLKLKKLKRKAKKQ